MKIDLKWKRTLLAGILAVSMIVPSYVTYGSSTPAVTEIPGTVHTETELNGSFLSVSGFAAAGVHDRSQYKEGDPEYAVVTNEYEFLTAISNARYGGVKVIELRADMHLGWNELPEEVKEEFGEEFIVQYPGSNALAGTPLSNPVLVETGISLLWIKEVDGLTIFSNTGNAIQHAQIQLNPGVNDVVIRNLQFNGTWEWDDWRQSGFGSTGGKGNSKRNGWTNLKINGANNVWIDHCSFGDSFDGNVDIENGSSGISLTWCEFGNEDISEGSMIYETVQYLEELYQQSKVEGSGVSSFIMYGIMRDNGMTTEQIMQYMVYHSKCHLVGSGDKDTWLVPVLDENGNQQYDENGNLITKADTTKDNANERLRLTLAYNYYRNMGQRVPMIRSGVGHLYNCYIDDMQVVELSKLINSDPMNTGSTIRQQIEKAGGSIGNLARCINARNGAAIGADTCVFYGVSEPLIGAEHQQDDGSQPGFEKYWTWNYALIVNSSSQKLGDSEAYVGSSWDNNGVNSFTTGFTWRDKSTINNWSWGQEGDSLSYEYQTFPLEDVVKNTTTYSGAGKIEMQTSEWLQTKYDASFPVEQTDTTTEIPIESISFQKEEALVYLDEYLQLIDTALPYNNTEDIKDYSWKSSNPEVAVVLDSGLVKPVAAGSTTITLTTGSGKTASCAVTVSSKPSGIDLTKVPDKMYVGDIMKFTARALPEDLADSSVNWSSEGIRIEFLDNETGIAKALSAGSNTVVAYADMYGNRVGDQKISAKKTIKVETPAVPVTGIELSDIAVSLKKGIALELKAAVVPTDATNQNVIWSAADESIATVDENGMVTGLSKGETTITVTSVNYGFTKTCTVKVEDASYIKGDVDFSGIVDSGDAYQILCYIVQKKSFTEIQKELADYNSDSKVDVRDVLNILKATVNGNK